MPEGGADEARLTADYNAEMIEQIARFPRVRDRAIFVGAPDDVVPHDFGAGLPAIRPWVEEHFDFSGYVLAPDAGAPADRDGAARRARLPARRARVPRHGRRLGRRRRAAAPRDRRLPAGARARARPAHDRRLRPAHRPRLAAARPRASSSSPTSHGLSRHLAACDVAVTQGGLTTCMELAAAKTPFVYFPLRRHFEQNLHVRHRLERYGAGRAIDLATATPETIAAAIAGALADGGRGTDVERDGAARAAGLIAELL